MIIEEIERLEEDYSKSSEVAWDYLNLLRSSKSSGLSQRKQKTGTSFTVGMLKKSDDIQSHTQTSQCINIEQNKQQCKIFLVNETSLITNTVLFYCNHQSDTTAQISNALNRTESKLSGKIGADGITPDLTCKAVNEITSGTEGKRRNYQGNSAGKESGTLTDHKNDDQQNIPNPYS